jgi:cell division protein FtsL
MIEVDLLIVLIVAELFLIFLVVAVGMVVSAFIKKQKDRKAVQGLIARVSEDEKRRKQETRELLQERFQLTGETLEEAVVRINHGEKVLYQQFINIYLNRDTVVFPSLNVEFEAAVEPYRSLEIQFPEIEALPVSDAEASQGDGMPVADEEGELYVLRKENARLSEELRVTMDTMSRMLNEYASMFSGGTGEHLDKDKLLHMFQAEDMPDADLEAHGDHVELVEHDKAAAAKQDQGVQTDSGAAEEGQESELSLDDGAVELDEPEGGEVPVEAASDEPPLFDEDVVDLDEEPKDTK